MKPERVLDPGNQPDRHLEKRHGVPSRRDLVQAQRGGERRGNAAPGIVIGNGSVILGPDIRELHIPAGTAHLTIQGQRATLWTTVLVKSGTTVADSDFVATPPDGTQAVTTGNNRLWTRVGGTWRYVALT